MWSGPGGPLRPPRFSPPIQANEIEHDLMFQPMDSFSEIMTASSSDSRSLDFEPDWISADNCHNSESPFVSSVMPYQQSMATPLDRRSNQPPQTYQRTNHVVAQRQMMRRQTTRLSHDGSPDDTQRQSQWGPTTYHIAERSTMMAQNPAFDPLAANLQNRLSPLPLLSLDTPLILESPPSSDSSEEVDDADPLADVPVYVVSDPPNTVSNLTVPSFPTSPPGFNCHISMGTDQNSFTVNVRFDVQDEPYRDNMNGRDRQKNLRLSGNVNDTLYILYDVRALSTPMLARYSTQALQLAIQLIRHAREFKTPDERSLSCLDCGQLPTLPVTGSCGHTRCTRCIQNNRTCPCGTPAPRTLHINILIQTLIKKMIKNRGIHRGTDSGRNRIQHGSLKNVLRLSQVRSRRVAGLGSAQRAHSRRWTDSHSSDVSPCTPMSLEERLSRARRLAAAGRLRGAAVHLARVAAAASATPLARLARVLLAQTISSAAASEGGDARLLARGMLRGVRAQSARAWLSATDLECVLCYHAYTRPVTTPCGHTYCRTCIERSMDYRKCCALCQRPLTDFDLTSTRETVFISAALASIDALSSPLPPDPDVIPIFVCTVAYPAIPCPLFIFDPRYWLMIRRVLETGSRKFGMVAYERDGTYSDYGTVLEVCDCVHLEDGRSILSTVGISRFRIIERDVRDGCDVARIQPLIDIPPTEEFVIWDLRVMTTQIWYKALVWLDSMGRDVRSEIEAAFGRLPTFDRTDPQWWATADGPPWLWWLIAILPLRSEIKVLILSTCSLLKRVMAVSRTLEAMDQVAMTATATSECELRTALNNAEEWLERGA